MDTKPLNSLDGTARIKHTVSKSLPGWHAASLRIRI
jgi:hypothetical protein